MFFTSHMNKQNQPMDKLTPLLPRKIKIQDPHPSQPSQQQKTLEQHLKVLENLPHFQTIM